jgi:hypothetical protein
MIARICSLIRMKEPIQNDEGLLSESGAAKPADATAGYQPACLFQDTTAGVLYVNKGSLASCEFTAVTVA